MTFKIIINNIQWLVIELQRLDISINQHFINHIFELH